MSLDDRIAGLVEALTICEEYRKQEYGPHGTEWVSCEEVDEVADEIRTRIQELKDLMDGM